MIPLKIDLRFAIPDACEGLEIFGAYGSGKGSGVLLTTKPDECALWEKCAADRPDSLFTVELDERVLSAFQDSVRERKES